MAHFGCSPLCLEMFRTCSLLFKKLPFNRACSVHFVFRMFGAPRGRTCSPSAVSSRGVGGAELRVAKKPEEQFHAMGTAGRTFGSAVHWRETLGSSSAPPLGKPLWPRNAGGCLRALTGRAGLVPSFCVTFYVLDSRNVRSKFHIGIG